VSGCVQYFFHSLSALLEESCSGGKLARPQLFWQPLILTRATDLRITLGSGVHDICKITLHLNQSGRFLAHWDVRFGCAFQPFAFTTALKLGPARVQRSPSPEASTYTLACFAPDGNGKTSKSC
jgi:hypothetical protein